MEKKNIEKNAVMPKTVLTCLKKPVKTGVSIWLICSESCEKKFTTQFLFFITKF
jgi:hypothetical protein